MKKGTKKTTKKVDTLVNFILDKSGSMQVIKDATIKGVNEYITSLKKDGNSYSFSLVMFDTESRKYCLNKPIASVKDIGPEDYVPGGWTALYDAVCSSVKDIEATIKANQKVLTVIMTDGEENSSKEYTQENLKDTIKRLEKTGKWSFVFLGANQDSWANASKIGISHMNTANFVASDKAMGQTFSAMSCNTRAFASNDTLGTNAFFSAQDQTNLATGNGQMMASGGSDTSGLDAISQHFSNLGKKSWEKRKKDLLG